MNQGGQSIEPGSRVTLHFTLRLATGETADTTEGEEPLRFVMGSGSMIERFESCLLGLRAGDKRRFEIPYQEAFGPSLPENVHRLPRGDFPPELGVEIGQVIAFNTSNGEEIAGTVLDVDAHEVAVDFSHPLAGHDLVFEVEIIEVQPA